ncbi:MAG: competence protein ComEC [Acidimicrobiales bacterium]|jgi:competence protein ComEC
MNDTVVRIRIMVLLILGLCVPVVWILPGMSEAHTGQNLKVHFLDVGQGDAIFIQTPDGVEVLIDGGSNSSVLRALSQRMSFFDRNIDMVIGTHPDTDHIGGLIDVLERYEVDTVLTTENEGNSGTAAVYRTAIDEEGAEIIFARSGQMFTLGDSVTLQVLFPVNDASNMESNTSSIVLQLIYGDTAVLLTGDSPKNIEEYLVESIGSSLQSDVLKVGHHGSRTSTSELFLTTVDPQLAIVSAEKDSRYGHPHVEVTDMLFNHGVETYSTAEEGTVTLESDGTQIWKQ